MDVAPLLLDRLPYVPSRRKMRDKSWINSRKLKEKVILGLAFEKNWRKIGANVTLQKIIRENRDNFDLIRTMLDRRGGRGRAPE